MNTTFISYLDIGADSVVPGAVSVDQLDPGSGNVFPKMPIRLNGTAWELWYFDCASEDCETALTVSFFRDARALKDGGWRVQVLALFPDGTMWDDEFYFAESIVTKEGDSLIRSRVHGVWKTRDDGASISFTVEPDLSTTKLLFRVPGRIEGTFQLEPLSCNKIGLPSGEADALLGPAMYYIRPISLASASVDLTFVASDGVNHTDAQKQKQLQLRLSFQGGTGGMDRCWSRLSWPQLIAESLHLRAKVGPYTMQVMRTISPASGGRKSHVTARLWKDSELVCAAQRIIDQQDLQHHSGDHGLISCQEDLVSVEKIYWPDTANNLPGVTGAFRDKSLGYIIEFVQGGRQSLGTSKRWRFESRHRRPWWNMPTSAPGPNATGNSAFLDTVIGGASGEMWPIGTGGSGQLQIE